MQPSKPTYYTCVAVYKPHYTVDKNTTETLDYVVSAVKMDKLYKLGGSLKGEKSDFRLIYPDDGSVNFVPESKVLNFGKLHFDGEWDRETAGGRVLIGCHLLVHLPGAKPALELEEDEDDYAGAIACRQVDQQTYYYEPSSGKLWTEPSVEHDMDLHITNLNVKTNDSKHISLEFCLAWVRK